MKQKNLESNRDLVQCKLRSSAREKHVWGLVAASLGTDRQTFIRFAANEMAQRIQGHANDAKRLLALRQMEKKIRELAE